MKKICIFLLGIFTFSSAFSQYVHTIKADSVKLTNDSCNTELIIENITRNVSGSFLYNKGNGRTEFKKILTPIGGNKYLIGLDTLDIAGSSPVISVFGRTGAVTAVAGDYSSYYPQLSSTYSNPSWITSLAHSKISYTGTSSQYIDGTGAYITFPTISNDTGLIHTTGNERKFGVLSLASNPILNSMTKGSIPFFGTGGQIRQNNSKLFWDSATNQLEVTGTIAIKNGSDGMRWVYNDTTHFASMGALNLLGGPTGFWNPYTTTGTNQNRTNVVSFFTMQRGFMLGTLQSRASNVMFDASRYKPDVTTYDIGDVVFNAGHTYYFDAKPEVINYQKVQSSGATVSQWNATVGYSEYEATTSGTGTFNTEADYLSKGSTYDIHIFAIIRNATTGVQSMWRENRIVTIGLSSLSPVTTFIAENQTIGTALKDTGISTATMTVSGTGANSNYSYLLFTGVSGQTVYWKVQVKRIEL